MLKVKNLSKEYHEQWAVKDVSFTVEKGEVLVLLGTSGCGKTTTLKMINRLIDKSAGRILINNEAIESQDPYQLRRDIGYVIQETGLFPHYSVAKNIAVVPELLHWPDKKVEERVSELLTLTGLPQKLAQRMPHELSGGQRQRVGLARALAADPSLILLDEPFGALDPITRKEMQEEFVKLEGALDKAMVLVTHDVIEAVRLADKICLMDKGSVQQLGSPQTLVFNPANEFVGRFFADKRLELEPNIVRLRDLAHHLAPATDVRGIEMNENLALADAVAQADRSPVHFYHRDTCYVVADVLKTYYDYRDQIIKRIHGDH